VHMRQAKTLLVAGLFLVGSAAVNGPSRAYAQGGIPDCKALLNPVFMAGTTAVIPVIRLLGARLKQVGMTLLWNENSDGCSAESLLTGGPPPLGAVRSVFSQYTEDTTQPGKVIVTTCNGTINQVPDLAINDVSFSSCQATSVYHQTLPPGFAEFQGPVQGLVPVVPLGNDFVNDITAEELQALYTCGAKANNQAGVMTFSSDQTIYDYNCANSGMRELWARGIGAGYGVTLSPTIGLGCGNPITAESMVTNYVGPSITPLATIGYTSTEYYDQYRNLVKGLKVRGVNQILAYLPDSDITSTDKLNIREGRYTIQNSLKLVAAVDSNGVPTLPLVKNLVGWFQGSVDQVKLPFDLNEIYALRGVVPQCAMRVTKDSDLPVFKHYKHPQPCHCAFQVLATGKSSIPGCVPCAAVDGGTSCPDGQICSSGYCEAI